MCLLLSRLFSSCDIFSSAEMPSFADSKVKMDHRHDAELREMFQRISFSQSLQPFNPHPKNEAAVYRKASQQDIGSLMQRNALLLSRVFIKNAKAAQLAEPFKGHREIRILDIGCGNALSLMGIFAYFGSDRVRYTGIDINDRKITECQQAYSQFRSVSFFHCDARSVTSVEQYDIVLVQHANILYEANVFTEVFRRATGFLHPKGTLYATFYYKEEADYFYQTILPQMSMKGTMYKNTCYKLPILDVLRNLSYCPEWYSFKSVPTDYSASSCYDASSCTQVRNS